MENQANFSKELFLQKVIAKIVGQNSNDLAFSDSVNQVRSMTLQSSV